MKKSLSILLLTVATLSLAACGNASKETATAPATTEASQKANTETSYPVTIKTYDAKGNEVEQVFEKAPERSSPTTSQQLKSYLNSVCKIKLPVCSILIML